MKQQQEFRGALFTFGVGSSPDTEALVAAILNDSWMVRHYNRPIQRRQRAQAIERLGLTVRDAFNQSSSFEALLAAVADGWRPRG